MKGFTLALGPLMIRCGTLLRGWERWGRQPIAGWPFGPQYYRFSLGPVSLMWLNHEATGKEMNAEEHYDISKDRWWILLPPRTSVKQAREAIRPVTWEHSMDNPDNWAWPPIKR